jgi:hypothetical protein
MPFIAAKTQEIETDRNLTNYAGEIGALYKYRDTGNIFLRYERGFVTPFIFLFLEQRQFHLSLEKSSLQNFQQNKNHQSYDKVL